MGDDKPELADVADDAELARQRWVDGRLRGHDNNMARMRSVTITGDPASGFTVRIANQFGFRCELEFGEDGRPARLLRCRAGERGWSASPAQIDLDCETNERDEVCGGDYMLGGGSGYRSRARFQLVRRLGRDER